MSETSSNSQPGQTIFQTPAFGITDSDLPDNSDPRCPCLLLLDVSGSMIGQPIKELQEGLAKYIEELAADPLARRRIEVAAVTFGGAPQIAHRFVTAEKFSVPQLTASGETPLGEAIIKGLDLLRHRKTELVSNGIPQYRAWVFLITDGVPTDDGTPAWEEAVRRLHEGERKKSFLFFAIGVQGASMAKLEELCLERKPMMLDGLRFHDLFVWLSASQKAISESRSDAEVTLPPASWGKISA